jgi:hypothetical protein
MHFRQFASLKLAHHIERNQKYPYISRLTLALIASTALTAGFASLCDLQLKSIGNPYRLSDGQRGLNLRHDVSHSIVGSLTTNHD